ncbi:CdaR family transcriptional regulator [Bacillus sinesaloumensis]|uniref:CdaR family transcriptional regulator n=1 Tax=Litchfieldia sinesaloumensis TaxID=1926280 RepID=UPI0013565045|nr:sugar diacid recognition domain-containing protein [Bacillus sinesaloumensis]
MLIPSLAKKIINEVRRLIDEDLIIVNISGTIIASTESSRIGKFHEGALLSARDHKKMTITKEMENQLEGVKAGINLPILFKDDVVGVIGITGNPEKVSAYGELLKKMTELFIQESYYAEQMELEARAVENFVFDWLQFKEIDVLVKRAKHFGINIDIKRHVVMGLIESEQEIPLRDITKRVREQSFLQVDDLFVRWGNERFLLLLAERSKEQINDILKKLKEELEHRFSVQISFGVGTNDFDYSIKKSFDEAERALEVAKKNYTITFDDDLKLEMLIHEASPKVQAEFIRRTVVTLLDDIDLINTVFEFIKHNQSIKETAKALHIHVNTLNYRLNKVEERTGLHPRNFKDLATLYIGFVILNKSIKIIE